MWTAKIVEKKITGRGQLEVSIDYTDGNQVIRKDIAISNGQSADWLRDRIMEQVNILEALDSYAESITEGDVDLTPVVKPESHLPTQAELDRSKWSEDYNRLEKLEQLLTKRLIRSNDAELLALRTSVEADFKPEYAELVSQ